MNHLNPETPDTSPAAAEQDMVDEDIEYPGEDFPGEDDESAPPHPVNWYLLRADELEAEWYALNRWVETLRRTYGLPASVIPPFWHRHDELRWELSALHLHWLCAYHPEQDGSAPFGWHRDFADARQRLREWVAASGTRLDRDRPTRENLARRRPRRPHRGRVRRRPRPRLRGLRRCTGRRAPRRRGRLLRRRRRRSRHRGGVGLMGTYVKKTNRRRYEDRKFSVRPVHRDAPDLHKLCEVLIRLTLQESGQSRIDRRAAEPPDTYRPATVATPAGDDVPRPVEGATVE